MPNLSPTIKFHAQYDWTTGVPDNGNAWRKYRVVPRAYPSHPLICPYFHRVGNKDVLDYQGRAGSTSIVQWTLRPVIFGVDKFQEQVSAEGVLHFGNPNSRLNPGLQIFEPRIWGPNAGVKFFAPIFPSKEKSPPQRFKPEFGLKIHIALLQGHFADKTENHEST